MASDHPRQLPKYRASDQFANLSPLDQIRQTEAEVTRKVVQAREAAGKVVLDACQQAVQTRQQARVAGEQEGKARYKEILSKSEDEATALVAEARQQADGLRKIGGSQMEKLVGRIVRFIVGLDEGL